MKIKPENKQADTQQERYGSSKDLLSSLWLDRNQPLWAVSHHCATGLTLREGRFMAKHLFLWRNQDFSSVNWVFHPWADNTAHEQTSALLSLPCPYSIITTHPHKTLPAKSASSKKQPLLISEDGEKREKDRKNTCAQVLNMLALGTMGGCANFSSPVKLPYKNLITTPSPFSLASVLLFTPIKQEKTLYTSLFLLETSSSFTSANLCFTLLKNVVCSTNTGYRISLLHCQNWRWVRFWGSIADLVESSHLIDPNVWKLLPNSANNFSLEKRFFW